MMNMQGWRRKQSGSNFQLQSSMPAHCKENLHCPLPEIYRFNGEEKKCIQKFRNETPLKTVTSKTVKEMGGCIEMDLAQDRGQ
jgi:hypothetical protein